uniref:Uncharacterized protein n=1 Tax=Heterosigma akashiwo TaxID=2829 RepID=A0A6V1UUZ4_HETAK|mmetsp:Transcript_33703/g.53067  ORF Transcript_33703/g.53067 Transcript_33703/m.53067 type:complete len:345 (-) Transcript_33703:379-1413(-)|eukprot:CAMPEP_0194585592 /NCGR_PEP_ID=MMETSP0292-20121207/17865_1 /TAXON_ID=39354 /ORGANISM="Heterosigma akashiwo, Strain CCMP2393" /LENGTH=344 /DNA_ID=CAMNT_0039441111 /DNA_START=169 /DNA_END=1203 /DNA_ORIENTATION=+
MFGMGMMGHQPQSFDEHYHCYSMACSGMDKAHLEAGDKIILPASALDTLARLHIEYPMLFQIEGSESGKKTHCGVLEFSAPEGSCYMPFWMMQNLLLEEGGMIKIKNVSLPKATFCKLKPQSVDFLDISNPRAVLEHTLRGYSCVTKGDVVCIPYNEKNYYLEIREVQPADAACIIETDCNVDFEEPVGYQEHLEKLKRTESKNSLDNGSASGSSRAGSVYQRPKMRARRGPDPAAATGEGGAPGAAAAAARFQAFGGSGARLDGKPLRKQSSASTGGGGDDEGGAEETKSVVSDVSSAVSASPGRGVPPRPESARKRPGTAGKWAKKKGLNTGAFAGAGNKLA